MTSTQQRTTTSTTTGTTSSRTAQLIERDGFAVVSAGFDAPDQGFTHTIGLAAHGLPELVVTGLAPVLAAQLTRHVAAAASRGQAIIAHQRRQLGEAAFVIRPVSRHWLANDPSRMAAWFAHSGTSPHADALPAVAQIVWGDAAGRFPGDPACDQFVADAQPIIADDPFGFPRRLPRVHHRHMRRDSDPGAHRRSA